MLVNHAPFVLEVDSAIRIELTVIVRSDGCKSPPPHSSISGLPVSYSRANRVAYGAAVVGGQRQANPASGVSPAILLCCGHDLYFVTPAVVLLIFISMLLHVYQTECDWI